MTAVNSPLHGDALAQLIQLTARKVGIGFRSSGMGKDDIEALLVRLANEEKKVVSFAKIGTDLMQASVDGHLPESAKAIIAAAVLAGNANYDLRAKSIDPRPKSQG